MSMTDVNYLVESFALFCTDSMWLPFEAGIVVISAIAMARKLIRGKYR